MAFQTGRQTLLPIKGKKIKKKNRYFHYLIFEQKGFVYLKKRIKKDIWHGLYEFFLIETSKSTEPQQLHTRGLDELLSGATLIRRSDEFRHLLTHQKLHIRFYTFEIHKEKANKILASSGYKKFIADEIEQLPKPIIIERYLKEKII
jgi:A/G-specific adenine glycosylase